MCFYLLVLLQVNDRVIFQINKVKKSKDISVSSICEWVGTLADVGIGYYYQIYFDKCFLGVSNTVLANDLHGDDAENDAYDEK